MPLTPEAMLKQLLSPVSAKKARKRAEVRVSGSSLCCFFTASMAVMLKVNR